jgi:hypothetical protein
MLSFDFPQGLLLLLGIPLLILLRRLRERPTRLVFTPHFLLELLARTPPVRRVRFLVLSRTQRLILAVLLVALLALVTSGVSVTLPWRARQRLLVVVDDVPLAARVFDGVPVMEAIRNCLLALDRQLAGEDTVTVMRTAASPSLAVLAHGREVSDFTARLAHGASLPPVPPLAAQVGELSRFHDRTVILSPRSALWRETLAAMSLTGIEVPPDRHTSAGNRGLTALSLESDPREEGRYDLFVAAVASGMSAADTTLRVSRESGPPEAVGTLTFRQGLSTLRRPGIALPPGVHVFSLDGDDAFPPDDRVVVRVGEAPPSALRVVGDPGPVMEAAIATLPSLVPGGGAGGTISLFVGSAPAVADGAVLALGPGGDGLGLRFRERVETSGRILWHPAHPLTSPLREIVLRPGLVTSFGHPPWLTPLGTVDGVPAVLAGTWAGHRVVVWCFDPRERGVFLKPEFLILLRESVDWLRGGQAVEVAPPLDREVVMAASPISSPGPEGLARPEAPRRERTFDPTLTLLVAALLLTMVLALAESPAASEGTLP